MNNTNNTSADTTTWSKDIFWILCRFIDPGSICKVLHVSKDWYKKFNQDVCWKEKIQICSKIGMFSGTWCSTWKLVHTKRGEPSWKQKFIELYMRSRFEWDATPSITQHKLEYLKTDIIEYITEAKVVTSRMREFPTKKKHIVGMRYWIAAYTLLFMMLRRGLTSGLGDFFKNIQCQMPDNLPPQSIPVMHIIKKLINCAR